MYESWVDLQHALAVEQRAEMRKNDHRPGPAYSGQPYRYCGQCKEQNRQDEPCLCMRQRNALDIIQQIGNLEVVELDPEC